MLNKSSITVSADGGTGYTSGIYIGSGHIISGVQRWENGTVTPGFRVIHVWRFTYNHTFTFEKKKKKSPMGMYFFFNFKLVI